MSEYNNVPLEALHKINIPFDNMDIFFTQVDDHYEILPQYLDVLPLFNLSGIDFTNVKVSDIDFSLTNASLDPQKVWNKDLSNGIFDRRNFSPFVSFQGVNGIGADFSGVSEFVNFNGMLSDERTKFQEVGKKKNVMSKMKVIDV